jgi:hypothetical protein
MRSMDVNWVGSAEQHRTSLYRTLKHPENGTARIQHRARDPGVVGFVAVSTVWSTKRV